MVEGEYGPEPVSTSTGDDSLGAGCCCDDEHEHGEACAREAHE
jgi:hypothetical protein